MYLYTFGRVLETFRYIHLTLLCFFFFIRNINTDKCLQSYSPRSSGSQLVGWDQKSGHTFHVGPKCVL